MKVLAFGEILWDVIEGKEHLGGAPFNFAAHCAQCGNESYIVSRLGTDPRGIRASQQCKSYGVNQHLVQWDEIRPTGSVDVTLTNGQPDYIIHENVAYDFIDPLQLLSSLPGRQLDVFYFGSLAQRNPASSSALEILVKHLDARYTFYDVNIRKKCFSEQILRKSLSLCNVFKLNADELPVISTMLTGRSLAMDEFVQALNVSFPAIRTIIVTAAEKGCYVFDEVTGKSIVPGVPVKVADAVGAGDAFSAAFMHMLANYGNAQLAAQVGNKVGAFVASQHGPIPKYSDEIIAFLSNSKT